MSRLIQGIASAVNHLLAPAGLRVVRLASYQRLLARPSDSDARANAQAVADLARHAMAAYWELTDRLDHLLPAPARLTCALCGHEAAADAFEELRSQCIFQGGELIRHRCPECGVIFGPQKMLRLDAARLDLEYRNLYRTYSEGDSSASVIRAFHLLQPRPGGVYLDYGCGGEWSPAMATLRGEGWNYIGFEPNARNDSPHVFSRWEQVEGMRFDGILTNNVLEHLFDPAGVTARLAALLKPGARLVHSTPCFDYLYDYTRFHVFFFTGRSPDVLAAKAGVKITGWERDGEFMACVMHKA